MNEGAIGSVGLSSTLQRHTAVRLLPVALITVLEHQAAQAGGSSTSGPPGARRPRLVGTTTGNMYVVDKQERGRSKEVRVLWREEELAQQW